jgi:adenylosuccinate lyase
MLFKLEELVRGLVVYPENMRRNMELTSGLYASQSALLKLTEKGMERKAAYEAVQRAAMKTWRTKKPLPQTLAEEPEVAALLSAEEIADACSLEKHIVHVRTKFANVGILRE